MTRLVVSVLGTAIVGVALVATGTAEQSRTPSSTSQVASPAAAPLPRRSAAVAPAASHSLSSALSARQQSELVGQYCAVAMIQNSLRVPLARESKGFAER